MTDQPPEPAGQQKERQRIVHDQPSEVRAVGGCVEVEGPGTIEVTFSVEAAEETSERLLAESFKARGQRRLERYPHQPKD